MVKSLSMETNIEEVEKRGSDMNPGCARKLFVTKPKSKQSQENNVTFTQVLEVVEKLNVCSIAERNNKSVLEGEVTANGAGRKESVEADEGGYGQQGGSPTHTVQSQQDNYNQTAQGSGNHMVESGEGVKKKKWKKIVRAGFAPTHRKAPILGRIRKERDTMREEGKQVETEGPLACKKRIINDRSTMRRRVLTKK